MVIIAGTFSVYYGKQAAKALRRMPVGIVNRIQEALLNIAANPATYHGSWKRLEGSEFWRLRAGSWRAVCDLQNGEMIILVLKVAPCGEVYK